MGTVRDRNSVWRPVAVYLGLVRADSGKPRSWWARVTQVEQDSSALEAGIGFAITGLLLAAVLGLASRDPTWFRLVALFAAAVCVGNLVRIVIVMVRRRRSRGTDRSSVSGVGQ